MKDNINERIRAFREYKNMSTRDIAKELGMSCGAISLIENGKRNPTSQFITLLCNTFPELNREWLENEEGEMIFTSKEKEMALIASKVFNSEEIPEEVLQLIDVLSKMNADEISALASFAKKMNETESTKKSKKKKNLPS